MRLKKMTKETDRVKNMKTVQDYLKILNKERLIEVYIYEYWMDSLELFGKQNNERVSNIHQRMHDKLSDYIDWLRSLSIQKDNKNQTNILYVSRGMFDNQSERTYNMCVLEEIREDIDQASDYSYMGTNRQQSVGYYVADTRLTKAHIYDLIADYLHESSFLGLDEAHFQESLKKLNDSLEEAENSPMIPAKEVWKDLKDKYFPEEDWEADAEDEVSHELYRKVICAEMEYTQYWKIKQRRELLQLLEEEDHLSN